MSLYKEDPKEYHRLKQKEWRDKPENKEKLNKKKREVYSKRYRGKILEKKYGLTLEEYNIMWNKQEGRCKICEKHEQELGKVLYVDHDHTTGKIRGLLCNKCNAGIGLLQDSVELLRAAANYLEEK